MADRRDLVATLTSRQLEVLRGVAGLESSKEIARRLGVTSATVDSYIAAAMQRLGAASRREAATIVAAAHAAAAQSATIDDPQADDSGTPDDSDKSLCQSTRVAVTASSTTWSSWKRGGGLLADRGHDGHDGYDGRPANLPRRGMGSVLIRYVLDGLYITLFFAIMSVVALGAHGIVIQCERRHIDPIVLAMLKGASYVLAALDAIGVITATGFLTFRFVRAIARADD